MYPVMTLRSIHSKKDATMIGFMKCKKNRVCDHFGLKASPWIIFTKLCVSRVSVTFQQTH